MTRKAPVHYVAWRAISADPTLTARTCSLRALISPASVSSRALAATDLSDHWLAAASRHQGPAIVAFFIVRLAMRRYLCLGFRV